MNAILLVSSLLAANDPWSVVPGPRDPWAAVRPAVSVSVPVTATIESKTPPASAHPATSGQPPVTEGMHDATVRPPAAGGLSKSEQEAINARFVEKWKWKLCPGSCNMLNCGSHPSHWEVVPASEPDFAGIDMLRGRAKPPPPAAPPLPSVGTTRTGGHWETRTVYGPLGRPRGTKQVWVEGAEAEAGGPVAQPGPQAKTSGGINGAHDSPTARSVAPPKCPSCGSGSPGHTCGK